jgi:hypothetical protein
MNIDTIRTSLQGKKTYIAAGMGVIYIAGVFLGLWDWDERVLGVFGLSGLAFLRAAVPAQKAEGTRQNEEAGKAAINGLFAPLLLVALLAGVSGCGTLSKDGVYQGDDVLFRADQSITATYDGLHAFVSWEYQNREVLSKWPEIRQAADYVRANAEVWINSATIAREQYAAFRSDQTRNALVDALSALRRSAATATSILELYGPSNSN